MYTRMSGLLRRSVLGLKKGAEGAQYVQQESNETKKESRHIEGTATATKIAGRIPTCKVTASKLRSLE